MGDFSRRHGCRDSRHLGRRMHLATEISSQERPTVCSGYQPCSCDGIWEGCPQRKQRGFDTRTWRRHVRTSTTKLCSCLQRKEAQEEVGCQGEDVNLKQRHDTNRTYVHHSHKVTKKDLDVHMLFLPFGFLHRLDRRTDTIPHYTAHRYI